MTAPEQPPSVPAGVHVFDLLGLQLTSGDLLHLRNQLPQDDLARAQCIVCEYCKRWQDAAGDDNSQDGQQRGRYTANKWLSLGGHNWIT